MTQNTFKSYALQHSFRPLYCITTRGGLQHVLHISLLDDELPTVRTMSSSLKQHHLWRGLSIHNTKNFISWRVITQPTTLYIVDLEGFAKQYSTYHFEGAPILFWSVMSTVHAKLSVMSDFVTYVVGITRLSVHGIPARILEQLLRLLSDLLN